MKYFIHVLFLNLFMACNQDKIKIVKTEKIKPQVIVKNGFYADVTDLNMKIIERGIPATIKTTIRNRTNKEIKEIYTSTSCHCLKIKLDKFNLMPNDSTLATFTYDAKVPGLFDRDVIINFPTNNADPIQIKVQGHVKY